MVGNQANHQRKGRTRMDTTTPAVATTSTPAPKAIPFATLDQYKAVLSELGISYSDLTGFLRVEAAAGRRLYVASTKTVRRVDISGWEHGLGTLTKVPHTDITGKVKQQMIVGRGPDKDIETFRALVAHMQTLEAEVKPAKAPKAKKEKVEVVASSPEASPSSSPELDKAMKRLAQIANVKKFAALRNQPVSQKVLDEEVTLTLLVGASSPEVVAQAAE